MGREMQADIRIVRQVAQLSLDEQTFLNWRRQVNHKLREVRRKRLALVEALTVQDEEAERQKIPTRSGEGSKHRASVSSCSLAEVDAAVKRLATAWTAWRKEDGDAR